LVAVLAALAVAITAGILAIPDHDVSRAVAEAEAARAADTVQVSYPSHPSYLPVPHSFLGISAEYDSLPIYARHRALLTRVLELLRVPGGGPVVLRIGGDTADRTIWDPGGEQVPAWALALTPRLLEQTGALVRRAHLRVILDLNLVTGSPEMGAELARAAESAFGPDSIVGFEIGNEPDLYNRSYWSASVGRAAIGAGRTVLRAIGYSNDFESYADAIAAVAPGVPLVGPAIANPDAHLTWLTTLLAEPHAGLGLVTAHKYPYTACARRDPRALATIRKVLSEQATAGLARMVRPAVRLTHAAGLPFRLDELNSVTCGGRPGVSNAFATSLWAPDALFELLRVGVDGVNVHVRAHTVNAAFTLNSGGLDARPLLYGMIAFTRMLGAEARLVDLRVRVRDSLHVKVWGVRVAGNELHVLVIDKGARPATVDLRLPASAPATVQRLLAASPHSRAGVTLNGQWLSRAGRWLGARTTETISSDDRSYELRVAPASAALISVRLGRVPRPVAAVPATSPRSRASRRSRRRRPAPV
jgi:hypothetical protein